MRAKYKQKYKLYFKNIKSTSKNKIESVNTLVSLARLCRLDDRYKLRPSAESIHGSPGYVNCVLKLRFNF